MKLSVPLIRLTERTTTIIKNTVANYSDKLKEGDTVFEFVTASLSDSDKREIKFDRNVDKEIFPYAFDAWSKMLLGFKINKQPVGFNIMEVIDDFGYYLSVENKFEKAWRKFSMLVALTVATMMATFLVVPYYIIEVQDFPSLMEGVIKNPDQKFAWMVHITNSKYLYAAISVLFVTLVILLFRFMKKRKFTRIQKMIEAYVINAMLYHSICNNYFSWQLNFYYFKWEFLKVISTLYTSGFLKEDDFHLYLAYADNIEQGSELVRTIGMEVAENLETYYRMSVFWERYGFYKTYDDIRRNYSSKRTVYKALIEMELEYLENEYSKWSGFSEVAFFIAYGLFSQKISDTIGGGG